MRPTTCWPPSCPRGRHVQCMAAAAARVVISGHMVLPEGCLSGMHNCVQSNQRRWPRCNLHRHSSQRCILCLPHRYLPLLMGDRFLSSPESRLDNIAELNSRISGSALIGQGGSIGRQGGGPRGPCCFDIRLSSPRRPAWPTTLGPFASPRLLQVVDLLTVDGDPPWSIDPQANLVANDLENDNGDFMADGDRFVCLA